MSADAKKGSWRPEVRPQRASALPARHTVRAGRVSDGPGHCCALRAPARSRAHTRSTRASSLAPLLALRLREPRSRSPRGQLLTGGERPPGSCRARAQRSARGTRHDKEKRLALRSDSAPARRAMHGAAWLWSVAPCRRMRCSRAWWACTARGTGQSSRLAYPGARARAAGCGARSRAPMRMRAGGNARKVHRVF